MKRSKEKKERALGVRLFLKGERCNSPKCAMVRRPTRPGMHGGKRRRAPSEYGQQLLEKQKIRISYGLREAQLFKLVKEAMKQKTSVGDFIVKYLERQLANVVFRLGLVSSRIIAGQLITHGHFFVNGKKVTIPSYSVKPGEIISINPNSQKLLIFNDLATKIKKYEPPEWLSLDKQKLEGKVKSLPQNVEIPFDINLVVDYYSK